ncbi:uncharacterized protein LOC121431162 isoform X2 [Lytechinus variegatus]|uniref:uncharacterized protein LOC121431162 isoform X2 n=1 Tax=Lytechinus variegatus TaxID=7654 RepID=UPI001BB2D005|nr:uncharacterized protein LOC121431162 isoform X2 [Lytechinus variegatus]
MLRSQLLDIYPGIIMDECSFTAILFFITFISNPCLAMYTISGYKLISKDRHNAGIVEVFSQERGWGIPCQDDWDFELASIVCRQLNFPGTALQPSGVKFNDDDNWPMAIRQNISTYYQGCSSVNGTNLQCEIFTSNCNGNFELQIGAVSCKEPGYLGCYGDKNHNYVRSRDRVLDSQPLDDDKALTVDRCVTICERSNHFYAGVEFSHQCFCGTQGEDIYRDGKLPDGDCSAICTGDRLESCGGSDKISIYQVGLGVCEDPGTPSNGFQYNETDLLRYGSKVYFNCSDGYDLQGHDVIQCVQKYITRSESPPNSTHDVVWDHDPPTCRPTGFLSTSPPFLTTKVKEKTNPIPSTSTNSMKLTKDQKGIIYISVGATSGLLIIVFAIGLVFLCRRHNRKTHNPVRPVTESTCASSHHGNGAGSPLMSRADGEHDFALTELTSHPETAGENDYGESIELRTPMRTEMPDRPGISRDAFGYESIRLPSTDDASAGLPGITDAMTANEAAYENSEFHEDPTHLIDNELYGKTFL